MKRYSIIHHTNYSFPDSVQLLPHTLRLRPREGPELRIESSKLDIFPASSLRWHRDIEGNAVATVNFSSQTNRLTIKSEVIIQQFDLDPLNCLVADHAMYYPFTYTDDERCLLAPYLTDNTNEQAPVFNDWLGSTPYQGEAIQSFTLLLQLAQRIFNTINYKKREEEGIQSVEHTLTGGTGSCRDLAWLFMVTARRMGIATRFVSGYLHSNALPGHSGSTHAWVESLLPGTGWKGFDPTTGEVAGSNHIAVAVARLPQSVPPVAGSFYGGKGPKMDVEVWVSDIS